MIRYAMIGTGWRSEFYIRLARLYPDRFQIGHIYTRLPEKAASLRQETGLQYTSDLKDILEGGYDFVIVCIKRGYCREAVEAMLAHNIPVLCETPPAESFDELNSIYKAYKGARIQFVEQYFVQPLYAAWLRAVREGQLGEVESVNLSCIHGYHAASMIRLFLNTKMEKFTIDADSSTEHVVETKSRAGEIIGGETVNYDRVRAKISFEGGKIAYYDFSGSQYHSFLRQRHLNIRGERGEIDDMLLQKLNSDGVTVAMPLERFDLGRYDNKFHGLSKLSVGEQVLYDNPFKYAPLNDDEIALASILTLMKNYVETGENFYSLEETLQDTYISLAIDAALLNKGRFVSEAQPWN